jgi:hypothetical protein
MLSFLLGTALLAAAAKYGVEAIKTSREIDLPEAVRDAKGKTKEFVSSALGHVKSAVSVVGNEIHSHEVDKKAALIYDTVKDLDESTRNKVLEAQQEEVVTLVIRRLGLS